MIVRKAQVVDNISSESETGDAWDRSGVDDQIAEPQAEAGLQREAEANRSTWPRRAKQDPDSRGAAIRVEANRDDTERLTLIVQGEEAPLAPTHWSFGQFATMVGAPSTYLRQLPAPLAAINLQY